MKPLEGRVTVVTGASRGAGRGIALQLGEAGATVYVTGRSVRGGPTTQNRGETIDETAEMVSVRGGVGIPVRCDHTVDAEITALFARVQQEQGRLDVLVNNAWGGYEEYDETFSAPFWEQPIARFDRMLTAGVRSHIVTSRFALPLMMPQRRGLIVNTTSALPGEDVSPLFYVVAKSAKLRAVQGMAHDLRPHGIAVVALAPGFMRTEVVLWHFGASEENWQTFPGLAKTETPQYLGRAVAALAADGSVMEKSGRLLEVGDLAREYGFTDIDGRYVPPFRAQVG